MADTPSIKIVKTIPRKGGTQRWSNRYHFDGGVPSDGAHWTTFADAIVALEKLLYESYIQIVEAIGYPAGSDLPVFSKTYAQDGTYVNTADDVNTPSDVAALLRYSTDQRSTKNHPIYLFNYYHGAKYPHDGPEDNTAEAYADALRDYGAAWIAGISDGSVTHHRAGPRGAVALSRSVGAYLTHRDFPN